MAPWIADQLRTLLAQRGHAWLLYGPSGLGQFDLALALVRAWLCEQPAPEPLPGHPRTASASSEGGEPRAAGSGGAPVLGACGQCASCHAIDAHTHADLMVLMPETGLLERGWPLPEKAQAEIDDKKRKPGKDIRVDAMRETIEFTQRTSGRGNGKAVLVYPAERMNAVSANALLKTLEEPPGDVRFVLATDAAHLLLPTIRSRCLGHAMIWPPQADALSWLAAVGVSEGDAVTLLRAAGGRPAEAQALAKAKGSAKQWSALPRALGAGDVSVLADVPLPEAVARLQKLCHDLMAVHTGAAPRFFDAADLPRHQLAAAALTRWWTQLAQVARTAEHPLNVGLATEFLVSMARQVLNSRG
ncbi:MAG: DNA polymerase III subunit delta' [Burkholderiaceae bacterium]|jgi:DNA polymerase-3 subunit delta'|nr:DNA polymerase III subunit delta' [Burkholderiaceae bacterium]